MGRLASRPPVAALRAFACRFEVPLVLAGSAICFALLALRLGQDASWDLQNYHFYNPHALLTGRLFWDIQPAMRQTYFNPALDVPFYLLATSTSPRVTAVALAVVQSLTLALTYLVARRVLRDADIAAPSQVLLAGALAGAGALAPLNVHQLGLTYGDAVTATLVLGALLLALRWVDGVRDASPAAVRRAERLTFGAGVLAGVAVGLKPTNAIYALALAGALFAAPASASVRARSSLRYAVGGLLGAALAGGYWWWLMLDHFGNPVFPQLNHLFRSPWAPHVPFTDDTFKATSAIGWLFYPFVYNELAGTDAGGRRFMDARLPALYLLAVGWGAVAAWRALARRRTAPRPPHRLLALFLVLAYVLWLALFSIDRYALLIEVLAPVAVVSLLLLAGARPRQAAFGGVAAVVVFALTFHRDAAGRRPWSDDYFDVRVPPVGRLEEALVVIVSHAPLAYVVPYLPASTRVVRIAGNLHYEVAGVPQRYANRMGEALRRVIAGHPGPVYVMQTEHDVGHHRAELRYFGLQPDAAAAAEIATAVGPGRLLLLPAGRVPHAR